MLDSRIRSFLEALFKRLDEERIEYCVLHSHEKILREPVGDIDLAIDGPGFKRIRGLLEELATKHGVIPLRRYYYDVPRACKYTCATGHDQQPFVALDFLHDNIGINRYLIPTPLILADRKNHGKYYAASPAWEFIYYLIKKVRKQELTTTQRARLNDLYSKEKAECDGLIDRFFGENKRALIRSLLFEDNLDKEKRSYALRRLLFSLKLRQLVAKPQRGLLWALWSLKRTVDRVRQPTGLIVGFISPDGGGKSTLAGLLPEKIGWAFDGRIRTLHWRPCLLPPPRQMLDPRRWGRPEGVNTTPHDAPFQSKPVSLIRFIYYILDYILGFIPKLYWPKVCNNLVIMDRYYYDFLVDRRRFRLDLPDWLPKFLLRIVPKVDILFFLTGDPEKLYARKKEVNALEIARQLNLIQRIQPLLGNVHTVEADKPLEDVINQITELTADYLTQRLRNRISG